MQPGSRGALGTREPSPRLPVDQQFELIENASDVIYSHDLEGCILYANRAAAQLTGYSQQELVSMNIRDLVAPEFIETVFQRIHTRINGTPLSPFELDLITRDGQRLPLEITTQVMLRQGHPVGIHGIARDARARKQADAALRNASEQLSLQKAYFEQLFESAPEAIVIQDNSGVILMANREFGRMFGYDPAEIVGKQLDPLIAAGDKQDEAAALSRHVAVGGRFSIESDRVRRDGSLVSVSIVGSPIQVRGGQVAVYVIYRDITERRSAEQALIESEAKFRAVADTAASAICIHDGKQFLYVNRAGEQISGYSRDELRGMEPFRIVHPTFRGLLEKRALARQRGEQVPSRYEFKIVHKSGEERWLDFSAASIHFGGQWAVLATVVDITDRKRAEQLHSALYQIAQQTSQAEDLTAFYRDIHHILSQLIYARNFYIALYDKEADLLSWPYFVDEEDEAPPAPRELRRGLTEYVLRTGRPLLATPEVFDDLVAKGEVTPIGADCIDWLGVPLKTGELTFGVLVAQSYNPQFRFGRAEQDILTFVSQNLATAIQHKRDEECLRLSETKYRELFSRAAYGIYRVAVNGDIVDANPTFIMMVGCETHEEALKLNMQRDVYANPDERVRILREHENGRSDNVETRWKRRDGKIINVKLSGRSFFNPKGEHEGYDVIAEDITDRRALEEQLRHAQKMEAVGRLAGGVAHDFNNLLTVIKGYSELIMPHLVQGDPMRAQVEEIRKAADRAASLTRQLLAFSRRQVLTPKVLDPNAAIINMDRLLRRLLGEDVALHLHLGPEVGRIKADPGQVEQVLMNLAVNARDAMPTGGHLTVETSNVVLTESWKAGMKFEPGPYVLIAVSDSGHGMSEDVQNRVFEPFFTTKDRGTGLGLSTVYGIVKQSGGYVWVYSEIGKGTTFKVYLPRVDDKPEPASARVAAPTQYTGTETVLLVEDEEGVRTLVRQMLQQHGYNVLETSNAGEAFILSERDNSPIHLLLTDVVLKQISGRELAQRISNSRPDTRVLYMSGYTEDAVVRHGVLQPGIAFLQKPFTADTLVRRVREVLDTPAATLPQADA